MDRMQPSIAVSSLTPPRTSTAWVRQVWRCWRASAAVFGVAGFQGGLLGRGDALDVAGLTTVGGVELLGQFRGAGFDRFRRDDDAVIMGGHADDSRTGRLLRPSTGNRRTAGIGAAQGGLLGGVVQLGGGYGQPVHGLAVEASQRMTLLSSRWSPFEIATWVFNRGRRRAIRGG